MSDRALHRCRIVAIGAANMDIAGTTDQAIAQGDSIPGRIRCSAGGVARNVAENLARLGVGVGLLSAVGDDVFGRELLANAAAAGVDVAGCWVLPGAATSSYLSIHGRDGEMATALNDMAILECVTPALLATRLGLLRQADALLLDCNLSAVALEWLFAHAAAVPVFVDSVSAFKCRRILPWLPRIHTLKANRLEAEALWGQPVGDAASVLRAAEWLHAQGVQQVVLSLGGEGVFWSTSAGDHGQQPPWPIEVVNATGAGDALLAGLLQQWLRQVPLRRAVRFASACAALTLTVQSANHPGLSVASVQRLLDQADAETQ